MAVGSSPTWGTHPCAPDWGRRSTNNGYTLIYCPDHPLSWSTGYVYEHRLVMEMMWADC